LNLTTPNKQVHFNDNITSPLQYSETPSKPSSPNVFKPIAKRSKSNSAPKLSKPGYYTIPAMSELSKMSEEQLTSLPVFTVGREGFGNVKFEGKIDVRGLDLDEIILFETKVIEVYPDNYSNKPSEGEGLNKPATITFENVWPKQRTSDKEKISKFTEKLKKATDTVHAEFIEYDADRGKWIFKVQHFSRYNLDGSYDEDDEDEEPTQPQPQPQKQKLPHPVVTKPSAYKRVTVEPPDKSGKLL